MTCGQTLGLLDAFLDGELPDADREAVASHLAGCQECARARETLARQDAMLRSRLGGEQNPGAIARAAERALQTVRRPRARPLRRAVPWATAAAAGGIVWLGVMLSGGTGGYPWRMERDGVTTEGIARAGDTLDLPDDAAATIAVGDLGRLQIAGGTRLRIVEEGPFRDLLYLERGEIRATIVAAPRRFQVGTPAGLAVDLGCVYTLAVEKDGTTRLGVRTGAVSFERGEECAYVPAGAGCEATPSGPLVPLWEDAPDPVRSLATGDPAPVGADPAACLAVLRPKDTLTLWHLLAHPDRDVSGTAFDLLAAMMPPPAGVARESLLGPGGDAAAKGIWRRAVEPDWRGSALLPKERDPKEPPK